MRKELKDNTTAEGHVLHENGPKSLSLCAAVKWVNNLGCKCEKERKVIVQTIVKRRRPLNIGKKW